MSNSIYEDKIYNQDRKMQFILDNGYKEGTQKIILRLFKVSQVVESELEKDLADFNREEIRRLGFLYAPKTEQSSNSNMTWLQKYIDWNVEEGLLQGVNPIANVSAEWKKQFVNSSLKRFWTDEEIRKIISTRVNKRDGAIVDLLFQGVFGSGGSEMLNLQIGSIDKVNNRLHLKDDNGLSRTIPVPEDTIDICLKAYDEDTYHKKNGKPSPDVKADTFAIVENSYIIRPAKSRTKTINEAGVNIIYSALARIAVEINEPNLTPLNIQNSGMIYYLKELYLDNNKTIVDEHFTMVLDRFNNKTDVSLYRMKADFLNEETILKVYPNL
ncbi:integrase [Paenibacillus sp. GCM10027627]|uniref:phage lytic cycle repressor MrpR family protein n=1 Tax=unclassified Paenibacillus TaxID=185978 RepID=UPI003631CCD2